MSTASNKLLLGFLGGGVLLFAVALIVREDAAVDSVADVPHHGTSGVAHAKEDSAINSATTHAADSSASPSALVRGDSLTLAQYDLEKPAQHFKLPKRLREISGLARLDTNRLLAHDDERGVVCEIDPRTGAIVKAFALSDQRAPVADDFEGIAAAEGRLYLVSSAGRLYEFGEGADGETVLYNLYTTGIGRDCEIEGLAYDPDQRVLLLISKNARNPQLADHIAIYRWSLDTKQLVAAGPLLIPVAMLAARIDRKQFQPSGIERHPRSGNYFVVAARQCAVAEITPQGQVRAVAKLAAKRHPQAEGIAFTADHALVISDEGAGKRATLTFYPVAKAR
ncbi:MAG: hypothetical protein F4Z30_03305 [Gemmatimonadetes bacterium]|nr:hypothetical protein [Gemmatimonadota bacterium]